MLADPEVEAVYIASPVQHHARQIMLCAEAGKHILCEKPLTRDLREARKAAAACRKRGVFLQEGYMMKFHGAHVKIKELIDQGKLGTNRLSTGPVVVLVSQDRRRLAARPKEWRRGADRHGFPSL